MDEGPWAVVFHLGAAMSEDSPSAGDHDLSVKIDREGCLHGRKERLLGICVRIADVLADGQMDSLPGA